jgi:hypothetical protein
MAVQMTKEKNSPEQDKLEQTTGTLGKRGKKERGEHMSVEFVTLRVYQPIDFALKLPTIRCPWFRT